MGSDLGKQRNQRQLERHAVSVGTGRVGELQDRWETVLTTFGAGSWLTGGAPPPYVRRRIDRQFARWLTTTRKSAETGSLVIAACSKSGTTRTILEGLRRLPRRQRVVWLRTDAASLAMIRSVLRQQTPVAKGTIAVLDDVDYDERDARTIARTMVLLERVGFAVVATMGRRRVDRLIPRIEDRVHPTLFSLNARLRSDERTGLGGPLSMLAESEGVSLRYLGAALSSVDVLRLRVAATEYDADHLERWAITQALRDGMRLYPGGISRRDLYALADLAFSTRAIARVWNDERFEAALKWARTPVGTPSAGFSLVHDLPAEGRLTVPGALLRHGVP